MGNWKTHIDNIKKELAILEAESHISKIGVWSAHNDFSIALDRLEKALGEQNYMGKEKNEEKY